MTFRILNTLDLAGCPEAVAAFDGIGVIESLAPDYGTVLSRIGEFDAYLASAAVPVDEPMVRAAKRLKVIGSPSTGTDHLDKAAIATAGIPCFDIAQEYDLIWSFSATSELAFGLILALNRGLCRAAKAARAGDWARERFTGFQLAGKTLGILGLGRLGQISARIGQGFGMRVQATDVRDVRAPGVARVDFDTLFSTSDVLTIHVHLTPETEGLVDARALALMRPGAILINTSRGRIVDEAALLNSLRAGRIRAGLDVIDGEWMEDKSAHPLVRYAREHDGLIITPHIGGATTESIYGARVFMARRVADFLHGLAGK